VLNTKLIAAAGTVAALLAGCGAGGAPAATSAPASAATSSGAVTAPTTASTTASATPTTPAAAPTSAVTGGTAAPAPGATAASTSGTDAVVGTDAVAPMVTTSASGLPTGNRVSPNFFGVHDSTPIGRNGWPLTSIGTIRVWDNGVNWREIEKSPGKYDFSRFDAIVRQANVKGAEILIVLGQTPRFYATRVASTDSYGAGAASMPNNINAFKRYVQAVANRPGVRGNPRAQFQVWNEANVVQYFNGSPAQMATLTKATRDALSPTRTSRYLVAPALVTRNSLQRTWTDKFYATKVSGRRVADYVNAVSLQLYPLPNGKPEDSMAILALDKKILAKYRVNKPIWNTEVNYGLAGRPVSALPSSLQAANISRTYLLNAAAGIKRVYWYAWGDIKIANTRTTTSNQYTLTAAGKAYTVTRSWLVNSQIRSCARSSAGTYTCTINYTGGVRRVFWNPTRAVTVAVAGATTHQLLDGTTRTYSSRTMRLKVGAAPVMIRSAR